MAEFLGIIGVLLLLGGPHWNNRWGIISHYLFTLAVFVGCFLAWMMRDGRI